MKRNSVIRIISFLWFLLHNTLGFCQVQSLPLFQKKDVLPIKIETNMKALLKDRGENPAYHLAKLSYTDEHAESVSLPVRVKVRGNFRRKTENCDFPPLLLDFTKKKGKKTTFDGQNKLKLVTQCKREDYVFHEYLVYEVYNLITDYSFKARLVEVTYTDSLGKRKPQTDFGFFLEDENDIAKRNGAKLFAPKNPNTYLLDSLQMATVALFDYMIGNNDFSMFDLHNIKLYIQTGKRFIPVPYDFDHAGIVEASYALPPPQIEISSIRFRVYRGLNYSPEIFRAVFDKFNSVKPRIYALYENNPLLNAGYIKRTIKYLDEFYEHINDPKAVKKYFVQGKFKF